MKSNGPYTVYLVEERSPRGDWELHKIFVWRKEADEYYRLAELQEGYQRRIVRGEAQ